MRRFTTPELDQILDDWDAQYQPDPFCDLDDVEPIGADFSWHSLGDFPVPDPAYSWTVPHPAFSWTAPDPVYSWTVPSHGYSWTSDDRSLAAILGLNVEDGRLYFPSPPPEERLASGAGQGSGNLAQGPSMPRGRGLVEDLGGTVIDGIAVFPPDVPEET